MPEWAIKWVETMATTWAIKSIINTWKISIKLSLFHLWLVSIIAARLMHLT